jgi:hypothetical protein
MSENEFRVRALRESVAPYASPSSREGVTKLSISLPTELAETLKSAARESGLPVSAVIAAALRRAVEAAEQEKLDRAIEAQNEEDLEWAQAYLPITAELWSKLEW